MSHYSHSDNAKFGLVLFELSLVGYGLLKGMEWLIITFHCVFQSF